MNTTEDKEWVAYLHWFGVIFPLACCTTAEECFAKAQEDANARLGSKTILEWHAQGTDHNIAPTCLNSNGYYTVNHDGRSLFNLMRGVYPKKPPRIQRILRSLRWW